MTGQCHEIVHLNQLSVGILVKLRSKGGLLLIKLLLSTLPDAITNIFVWCSGNIYEKGHSHKILYHSFFSHKTNHDDKETLQSNKFKYEVSHTGVNCAYS